MRKEVFQMDEKKEKKSMKNNLEYFWMYYKLPFIAGMIVVILAMYFLITTLWIIKVLICRGWNSVFLHQIF